MEFRYWDYKIEYVSCTKYFKKLKGIVEPENKCEITIQTTAHRDKEMENIKRLGEQNEKVKQILY